MQSNDSVNPAVSTSSKSHSGDAPANAPLAGGSAAPVERDPYRERVQWLMALKAGDMVALPARYGGGGTVAQVERTTQTLVILKSGGRYRRSDGRLIGSDVWLKPSLQQVTPEFLDAAEANQLRYWLQTVADKRHTVSLEALRAMKAGYDNAVGAEPSASGAFPSDASPVNPASKASEPDRQKAASSLLAMNKEQPKP